MRTWHGYGLSIRLSNPLCSLLTPRHVPYAPLHSIALQVHYTELRQITFLAARHVPYATPSGELRLLVRDQMPRDLTGPFVSQPVYVWPGGHVKYVRLLVRVQMPNCPHPETQLVLLFLTQHLAIKCQICETPSQEIGMELDGGEMPNKEILMKILHRKYLGSA